jgi:DNA-binding ferritin-like protein
MKKHGKLGRQKRSIERLEATIAEYEKVVETNTEGLAIARKEKDQPNINMCEMFIGVHEKKIVVHRTTIGNTKRNMS